MIYKSISEFKYYTGTELGVPTQNLTLELDADIILDGPGVITIYIYIITIFINDISLSPQSLFLRFQASFAK